MLVALFAYRPSPMLLIVGILGLPQLLKALRFDKSTPRNLAYCALPAGKNLEYGCMYLGRVGVLSVMAYEVHATLLTR